MALNIIEKKLLGGVGGQANSIADQKIKLMYEFPELLELWDQTRANGTSMAGPQTASVPTVASRPRSIVEAGKEPMAIRPAATINSYPAGNRH